MKRLISVARQSAWRTVSRARLWREFGRDARRYATLSTPTGRQELAKLTGAHLETQVTKDYHRIEKGLAFPEPRRPFGDDARNRLLDELGDDPISRAGKRPYVTYATEAMTALDEWNESGSPSDVVTVPGSSIGAHDLTNSQTDLFFRTRRSVRSFDVDRPVDAALIAHAVELAGNAPSVCNRQAWRAHFFGDYADVQAVLSHQSGNRGFGHTIPSILVITADVRMFSGTGERNQRWIDGSLFAMSVVWALHALGVSTCMLNWSKDNASSAQLRTTAGLGSHEDIIAMIAVGYPSPAYRVARSSRRELDDILVVHGAAAK